MAITICAITGVLRSPAGDAMPNAVFTVAQAGICRTEDGASLPQVLSRTASGSGEVSFGLLPGRYVLTWAPGPNARPYSSPLSVPFEATADLADLLVARDIPQRDPVGPAQDARDAAEAARDLAQAWAEGHEPGGSGTQSAMEWAGEAGNDAAQAQADRIQTGLDRAATGADRIQTGLDAVATGADAVQTGLDRVQTGADALSASGSAALAVAARGGAETARDAAFVAADVYASVGAGLSDTGNGEQFQVVTGDELVRYRNSSGSAVEVARYPAAQALSRLLVDHGHLAALLGQLVREAERLRAAQGASPPLSAAVGALASIVNQLARQTNGGRIALAGGTLDDPAIRIGPAGVYSAADNTISVSIAGVERLRVTAAGITVFGTVTEV